MEDFRPESFHNRAAADPIPLAKTPLQLRFLIGAPSGFRTPDPLIKSQLLYQLS